MKKPAIIFIHGLRGSHEGLVELSKRLDEWDCFLPDIPPFGKSKPLKSYDPDSYADFIKRYIEENKIEKPILVGHSMGSVIAVATAEKYPELINNKLVLLAPISVKPPKSIASLHPVVTVLPNNYVSYITTRFLSVSQDHKTFKGSLELTIKCAENYTSKKDVREATKFSVKHCIKDFQIKKDVLFLAGESDRLIAQRHTKKLAESLGTKAVFVKNTGHLLNYEKPAETASIIRQFLEK